MEIDANVYNLLNLLLQVILWSLIISTPAIILTVEMYAYEKYKKWKDTEIQEKEKIIVGRATKIVNQDEQLQRQHDEQSRLELDVKLLEKRKTSLKKELGLSEESESKLVEETIDYDSMNIKELKALAKERGHKMYSKKNKQQLVQMFRG